jgi:hypothetical protein
MDLQIGCALKEWEYGYNAPASHKFQDEMYKVDYLTHMVTLETWEKDYPRIFKHFTEKLFTACWYITFCYHFVRRSNRLQVYDKPTRQEQQGHAMVDSRGDGVRKRWRKLMRCPSHR